MKNMCLELINNYLKDYNEFKSTLSNLNINAISIDIRIEEFKKLYNKLKTPDIKTKFSNLLIKYTLSFYLLKNMA